MVWVVITVVGVVLLVVMAVAGRQALRSRARPQPAHAAATPSRSVEPTAGAATTPPAHRQCPRCGRRQVEPNGSGLRCGWCAASWALEGDRWPDVTLCLWIGQGQASLEENRR